MYVQIFSIFIFFPYFFFFFHYDFIIYTDYTHIAASNTATDDVTNWVIHRVFNSNILYSCAYFIIKIGEKSSLVDDF